MKRVYYVDIIEVNEVTFIKEFLYNAYTYTTKNNVKWAIVEHLEEVLNNDNERSSYAINGVIFRSFLVSDTDKEVL